MSRLFAVGDIHGCLTHLVRMIEAVRFDSKDRIVFIGDYIDRGPDSRSVVDLLLDFRETFPRSVFLRGNHEEMFEDYLQGSPRFGLGTYTWNGGRENLISYEVNPLETVSRSDFPDAHLEFLFGTELMFQEGEYLFVHAGIRPGVPLEEQSREDLLWIRDEFFAHEHDLGLTVVFGHTPFRDVFQNLPFCIGIDTGAAYGGRLTCVELADGRVRNTHQV